MLLSFPMQNFLNPNRCPEIQGFLYMKETGRKSWKKLYMFLRRSGLYYSTKGISKASRALCVSLVCIQERGANFQR